MTPLHTDTPARTNGTRRRSLWLAGGVLLLTAAAAALGWTLNRGRGHTTSAAPVLQLQQVVGRCVEAMVRNNCTVMTGPAAGAGAEVIFVAGVGPVDARAYEALRANGQAMCTTVQDACERDWSGNACRTARKLWGDPPAGP